MGSRAKQPRENRTITVDFQNEATYFQLLGDGKAFLEFVFAFLLSMGFQLTHKTTCHGGGSVTRHSHDVRIRLGGVTIWRIQCATCKAVFTVLPHFVLRYRQMRPDVARDALLAALGDTVGACGDVRLLHHGHHASPRGGTRPRPQRLIQCAPAGAPLDLFEAVHHVQCVQQDGRHGYRSVHPFAAFFQAFHHDHLVRKIHPPGGEVEGFGETAPGVIEDATKGAHRPTVPQGGAEERLALFGGEVEAPPKRIIEISGVTHTATGYKNSVTIGRVPVRCG
jgi:hypothetical protein